MRLGLLTAFVVLVADQLSKLWVRADLLGERGIIMVNDYFNIVSAWNTGVSFSMFNDYGLWGVIGLSVLAIGIVGYLLYWMSREQDKFLCVTLGFIVGGALGNVIDRVRLGAVFDFLDFHIGTHHWPAFNVADSFICIGAVLIILHSLWARAKSVKA